jgi:BRCA1-associated ATM activator 1
LAHESEGVVRREAVACIAAVYRYQQIPPQCLDMIFSVIAHCAVNDFYWEVKVNALGFWSTVICRQFTHQGMIDGTFPAVTFSKEHKKIITLTDKEIQLRLRKVLNELSLRGCLGILMACMQDSDLEVVRKVITVVEKLLRYLSKYNFIEEYNKSKNGTTESVIKPVIDSNYSEFFNNNLAEDKNPIVRNNADFSKTTEITMSQDNGDCCPNDMIIDSIVQEQDLVLLSNNYKANLNLTCEDVKMGKIDENLFKKYATVSTDEFLHFINNTDLAKVIENKSDWLQHCENFSTLLDDVLRSFGHNVDLDCY